MLASGDGSVCFLLPVCFYPNATFTVLLRSNGVSSDGYAQRVLAALEDYKSNILGDTPPPCGCSERLLVYSGVTLVCVVCVCEYVCTRTLAQV
jgi:hypothetical protein